MPEVEIELTRHRIGVAAVGLLDQQKVAEATAIAEEGERVFAASSCFETRLDFAGIGKPQPRLAEQIQSNVGERDILFEHRPVADPLAEPLREHQIAVGKAQQVVEEDAIGSHRFRCVSLHRANHKK